MRNEGELPKLVVTTAANHNGVRESNRTAVSAGLGSSTLAAILGALAEQLCLQRKDVIQDAIDAPALEPMVRDHTGPLEMIAQRAAQGAVDARPPSHLGLLQQLQGVGSVCRRSFSRERGRMAGAIQHVSSFV